MTEQEYDEAIGQFNEEHAKRCTDRRIVSLMHLDGRDWFSWNYECQTCGATIATTNNRHRNQRKNRRAVSWSFIDD